MERGRHRDEERQCQETESGRNNWTDGPTGINRIHVLIKEIFFWGGEEENYQLVNVISSPLHDCLLC